jgi:hypothetical protein
LSCSVPKEPQNKDFKAAASYAICSALYWGQCSADIDGDFIKKNYCGKTINAEVWKQTDDLKRDFYYLVIPKYSDFALTFINNENRFYFIDYRINSNLKEYSKILTKNYKLEVPQDWKAVAKGTGDGIDRIKTLETLKTTLKSFWAPNRKATHHFYVGPYTKFDSLLQIYDVENKEILNLPAPMNNNYHDLLKPRAGLIHVYPIEFSGDGKTIPAGRDKTIVDNCKIDGTLIEIK